jgi:hypothetical protein
MNGGCMRLDETVQLTKNVHKMKVHVVDSMMATITKSDNKTITIHISNSV